MTLFAASAVQAEAEKSDVYSVRLCNLSYSIKVKAQGRQLKTLNAGYVGAWQQTRPDDAVATCRRLYANSDKERLDKLISIGKAEKATHLVAPTAGKKGAGIELSFWLVDVNQGEVIGESTHTLPIRANRLTKELPEAWQKAVEKLLPTLGATATASTEVTTPGAQEAEQSASTDEAPPARRSPDVAPPVSSPSESAVEVDAPSRDGSEETAPATSSADSAKDPTAPQTTTQSAPQEHNEPNGAAAVDAASSEGIVVGTTAPQTDGAVTSTAITHDASASADAMWGAAVMVPIGAAAVGAVAGAVGAGLTSWLTVTERHPSEGGVPGLGQVAWVGALVGAGAGAIAGALVADWEARQPSISDKIE